ncbi:hypothetical protein OH77DRAFT_1172408 [Trametes cingulata]|nr:hypothetical protein OH77DRAFT_1172408 [Trametes cingulata]
MQTGLSSAQPMRGSDRVTPHGAQPHPHDHDISIEAPAFPSSNTHPLSMLRDRVASYTRPPSLRFSFPPQSPTSMYPGPFNDLPWEHGPSGLVYDAPENAQTLLYVAFLRYADASARALALDSAEVSSTSIAVAQRVIEFQLERMETFRREEWQRQQEIALPPHDCAYAAGYHAVSSSHSLFDTSDAPNRVSSPYVIHIPHYDRTKEVADLTALLDRWNERASSRPPYTPASFMPSVPQLAERHCVREAKIGLYDMRINQRSSSWFDLSHEIFLKVLGYLSPVDLLTLARTDKRTRQRLMARSSRPIWVEAIERVPDFPGCPPYMSEPHYVALIFGGYCMGCGKASGLRASVALGWRLCEECCDHNLIPEGDVKDLVAAALNAHGILRHPVLRSISVRHILPHCWLSSGSPQRECHFYAPEVDLFIAEYLPLVAALVRRGSSAREVLNVVMRNRRDSVALKQQFCNTVRYAIRPKTLRTQIFHRIRNLGYTACDIPRGPAGWDELLDSYRLLTDDAWERVRPLLVEEMDRARQERMRLLAARRAQTSNRIPHEE